jgi:hypothetical protein
MGVLFSRVWTINLKVGLCITGNKAYFDKITFTRAPSVEGVADEPLKVNGYFLYTVNNIQVPLIMPRDDVIIEPGR